MKEMCRNFICNNTKNSQAAPSLPDYDMDNCRSDVINRIGLAQAYIPSQPYSAPMDEAQSLVCGTVFSELVMPYCSGWNLYRFSGEV